MEPLTLTFAAVAGAAILGWAATSVYTVSQKTEALITSFGKHVGTTETAGIKLKKPWPLQSVEARIPTSLQQVTDTLDTKTKDNLFVGLPITIQFEVEDTAKYYFDTRDPINQMAKIVSASVRKYTSGKDFQELYDEREEISDAVIADVKSQIDEYGINIRRIVVDEPKAPGDVEAAYNRVRASEREMDAAKNEADAEYIRTVRKAEADKERNILIGQGVAGFRKNIAEGYAEIRSQLIEQGVNADVADRFMEEAMRLDTIRDVGDKGNMVIVTPASGPSDGADLAKQFQDMATLSPAFKRLLEMPANDAGATSATVPNASAPKVG